jgi:hypothetical protein
LVRNKNISIQIHQIHGLALIAFMPTPVAPLPWASSAAHFSMDSRDTGMGLRAKVCLYLPTPLTINIPHITEFLNMAQEIRTRSPITGSQFAAWGGMFSIIDCCLVGYRKKVSNLHPIPIEY